MITKVRLHNIQSHKDTHVDFSNGVNVIVGLSDAGKSAIIRGLLWVITGRPLGDSLRRKGEKEHSVTIELSEGIKITKRRTSTENQYIIIHKNGEKETLNAVGHNIPREIEQIFNIDLHSQIQRQKARPFLLDESAGDVSAFINEIAHLTDIDKSLKFLNADIRQNQHEQTRLTDEIKNKETDLQSLWWVEPLLGISEQIEIKQKNFISQCNKKQELESAFNQAIEVEVRLNIEKNKASLFEIANALLESHRAISSRIDSFNQGHILIRGARKYAETSKMALIQKELMAPALAINSEFEKQFSKIMTVNRLDQLIEGAYTLQGEIEKCEEQRKTFLQQIPKTCPECGQPLPH